MRGIKVADRCFENMAKFRYLGTTITNQNLIQEEIKRRLNSGNACYHSVQNLLSSRLLSKNTKIRMLLTIANNSRNMIKAKLSFIAVKIITPDRFLLLTNNSILWIALGPTGP
jgi:hypothetical protein